MFHSQKVNDLNNWIQERVLKIVYKDCQSTFQELLSKYNSLTFHQRDLQKVGKKEASPKTMTIVFDIVESRYGLRNETKLKTKNIHTVGNGTENVTHIGPKIWNLLPNDCETYTIC